MSHSAFRKKKAKDVTRKMLIEKINEMSTLMSYMESALIEWEIWHKLLPMQKDALSEREYNFFLEDGPIFEDEIVQKVVQSIRENVPEMKPQSEEEKIEQDKPALFDGSGNIIEKTNETVDEEDDKNEESEE
ncbi:MAG: hypothetical protein ACOC56_03690 [Atribacterota bacterium]